MQSALACPPILSIPHSSFQFYVPGLAAHSLPRYKLVILHSPLALRLGAYAADSGEFLFFEDHPWPDPANIEAIWLHGFLSKHPVIGQILNPEAVYLEVQTGHFAWLPSALFDSEAGLQYLNLTTELAPDAYIPMANNWQLGDGEGDLVCQFAVQTEIYLALDGLFGTKLKVVHHTLAHLAALPALHKDAADASCTILQVLIEENWVGICASKNGKPLLGCACIYEAEEDLLEYVQQIADNLAFDYQRDIVIFQGQVLRQSAIFKKFFPYFSHLRFASFPFSEGVAATKPLGDLEAHRYYDFFATAAAQL